VLAPDSCAYNTLDAVELKGRLNVAALERSVNLIIQRHEILRTSFPVQNGIPHQLIAERSTVSLCVEEVEETKLKQIVAEENARPFHLNSGPLLRIRLLRVGPDQYILLFAAHHIIIDGWSTSILLRELAAHYVAETTGAPTALPELSIQYGDFTLWQRECLRSGFYEPLLLGWKKRLGRDLPRLQLIADHPRPEGAPSAGDQLHFTITAEMRASLQAFCRSEGATLFMVLLSAFANLLARYTQQRDMVIGTPSAGRTRLETEDLIGYFVNTLPLRIAFEANETFRTLLHTVRAVSLDAFADQDAPLPMIIEALGPKHDARTGINGNPVFQTLFSFREKRPRMFATGDLQLRVLELGAHPTTKFDLSLEVEERDFGLFGCFEYSTDLFERNTIAAMARTFVTLIERGLEQPDAPLLSYSAVSDDDLKAVCSWNDTTTSFPSTSLDMLVASQVKRSPDSIALESANETITYKTLSRRANGITRALTDAGVVRGRAVAVLGDPTIDAVVAILGVLQAGCVWVPLDPGIPRVQRGHILTETKACAILITGKCHEQLDDLNIPVLVIREIPPLDSMAAEETTRSDADAYVIYTSGSSGSPKGVVVTQLSICNRILWADNHHPLFPSDRVLLHTSLSFDVSVCEIFETLCSGARLIVADPHYRTSPPHLAGLVARQKITVVNLVPSMLGEMLREPELRRARGTLRTILCGGEEISASLAQSVRDLLNIDINVLYGTTEATVDTLHSRSPRRTAAHLVPVGRPIQNVRVYLLDANKMLVPPGAPGEIAIGGTGLGRYLDSDLSAGRFVQGCYDGSQDERLYLTGDLGRLGFDGEVEFLGRMDRQLKVRGVRIEPAEIEAHLVTHPAVHLAAVDADNATQRLIAYVVPTTGSSCNHAELRRYLRDRVRREAIPDDFVTVHELLRNSSGKIDRARLRVLAVDKSVTLARNDVEALLVNIWQGLLGIHEVDIFAEFFDLGGHSILAARMVTLIQEQFGRSLPISAVLEEPTIAAIAKRLQQGDSWSIPRVIPLSVSGSRRSLVFVHPIGGHVVCYRPLAKKLVGFDVYGVRAMGLLKGERTASSIHELASMTIEQIAEIRTEGMILSGWSFGGLVALEMGRQFAAMGVDIKSVILLDSYLPAAVPVLDNSPLSLDVLSSDVQNKLSSILQDGLLSNDLIAQLGCLWSETASSCGVLGKADIEYLRSLTTVIYSNLRAFQCYEPARYDGKVNLLATKANDPTHWRAVASQLSVFEISGHHHALLQSPSIDEIAAAIRRCS
jgi:amino acid adenylation domain-containing protein